MARSLGVFKRDITCKHPEHRDRVGGFCPGCGAHRWVETAEQRRHRQRLDRLLEENP